MVVKSGAVCVELNSQWRQYALQTSMEEEDPKFHLVITVESGDAYTVVL